MKYSWTPHGDISHDTFPHCHAKDNALSDKKERGNIFSLNIPPVADAFIRRKFTTITSTTNVKEPAPSCACNEI